MKAAVRLFLVLITLVVLLLAWMTRQLGNPKIQLLIVILVASGLATFLVMNLLERREMSKRRKEREDGKRHLTGREDPGPKRSDTSFALRERKAGLTWGGGNIKASEATRGIKRKFLGK
jgi:hypothetical protein